MLVRVANDDGTKWIVTGGNLEDNSVVLLTGTGVVPPDSFTLQAGDVTEITISGIGMLRNTVVVV